MSRNWNQKLKMISSISGALAGGSVAVFAVFRTLLSPRAGFSVLIAIGILFGLAMKQNIKKSV